MAATSSSTDYLLTDELLRKPRRKRCGKQVPLSPFPIPIQTITRQESGNKLWYYFFGLLKSDHVAVYRKGDLAYLYQMGFFGKGILSKSQPQFNKYDDESLLLDHAKRQQSGRDHLKVAVGSKQTLLQEKLRQHAKWRDLSSMKSSSSIGCSSTENPILVVLDQIDIPEETYDTDGDDEDEEDKEEEEEEEFGSLEKGILKRKNLSKDDMFDGKAMKSKDPYKLFEYLQLTFEEAFFLSYGLGCLSVEDDNKSGMDLPQMWTTFSRLQKDFVARYTAYHHFRSKGWIVRFSNLFGADFVLYQSGMPFYHASYSVFVKMLDENELTSDEDFSWKELNTIGRVNEKVAKEVMICYVVKPKDVNNEELKSADVVKKLRIMELVVRRWIPEKHREIPTK